MAKSCSPDEKAAHLQKKELEFWETLKKSGEDVELKLARDLPDNTPDFILSMLSGFERDVAEFCFANCEGLILDAGCGNGNLLLKALSNGCSNDHATRFIGMDFSRNMLNRAALRAGNDPRACFLQGSVSRLPFKNQTFDWLASSGVLTCLSSVQEAAEAMREFYRVLKPGGVLVVDFFNSISHYTLLRRHLLRETIEPPEYVSPSAFCKDLEKAGFQICTFRGFDFKPIQGYLFMSSLRPLIDPFFIQEKFSCFLESKMVSRRPELSLLGYRVYVKCRKKRDSLEDIRGNGILPRDSYL